jgi:hypothetical protein
MIKEKEFSELVTWIVEVGNKVTKIMGKTDQNPFENVTYTNIVGSLLRLLDGRILPKEL